MGIYKIIILVFLMVFNADARPISYSGGTTIMYKSDTFNDSIYLHYSPTYKYSIGLERAKNKFYKSTENYFRFTYLVNRKNTDISQRNLYFQSGVLVDDADGFFYGMHGDWETRRWFTALGYENVVNGIENYSNQYLQLGVAPYLGDYGDLHTWIMLKTKKNTLLDGWSTYPVLKFFRGDFLIEIGYNNKTKWDAHLMHRF